MAENFQLRTSQIPYSHCREEAPIRGSAEDDLAKTRRKILKKEKGGRKNLKCWKTARLGAITGNRNFETETNDTKTTAPKRVAKFCKKEGGRKISKFWKPHASAQ